MRILIADDSAVSRSILKRALFNSDYELVMCGDGLSAWEALQKPDAPHLAILDRMMPGLSGTEVCERIRARTNAPYVYILLLTACDTQEDIVAGIEAGADDYLTKPFNPDELKVRLQAGRRIVDLESALVSAREALRERATRDSLTGLWNRRAIMEIVEKELARGARDHAPVGILLADLDHFKSVNDRYGHAVGDAVLQESTRRLLSAVRPYDSVGRYGGEEFLLVLPGCEDAALSTCAERIRKSVASEPIRIGEISIGVTSSFGAGKWLPGDNIAVTQLLSQVDMALYEAKRAGRNRVAVADLAVLCR